MRKRIAVFLVLIIMFAAAGTTAYASGCYTYNYWKEAVETPDGFKMEDIITGESLGISSFSQISDMFIQNGNIYILDSGNNRIVVADQNNRLKTVIDSMVMPEEWADQPQSFDRPKGICLDEQGNIYVADTRNQRIVKLNEKGVLENVWGRPGEQVVDEGQDYLPSKIAVDPSGRIYAAISGVYQGVAEFDESGIFRAFIGAPKVKFNIATYLWKQVSTKEQLERMEKFIPTEFSNIVLDDEGFLYTVCSTTNGIPLQRLNAKGIDVLKRLGHIPPSGDFNINPNEASVFVDVAVDKEGGYSAVDSSKGRIFTYDSDGNLLFAFGRRGLNRGDLETPVAIAYRDNKILVADSSLNCVNIYAPTEYGLSIREAIVHHSHGRYDEAGSAWLRVIEYNGMFDLAYSGLGKIEMVKKDYEAALQYFKIANNKEYYSKAYDRYRMQQIKVQFPVVMSIIAAVIAVGVICLLIYKRKRRGKRVEQ